MMRPAFGRNEGKLMSTSTNSDDKEWYNTKYLKENCYGYREWIYGPYIRSLVAHLAIKTDSTLLDVGCGQGFFSYLFRKCGMRVLGVDISEIAITKAKEMYGSLGLEFIVGDPLDISFPESFDCVFARSFSPYNNEEFQINSDVTETLLHHVKEGGTFIFAYNTKLSPTKKSETWRYHTLPEATNHFSKYCNARTYFVSKWDTTVVGKFAFTSFVTKINVLMSKVTGFGGDLICIVKKVNTLQFDQAMESLLIP